MYFRVKAEMMHNVIGSWDMRLIDYANSKVFHRTPINSVLIAAINADLR